MDMNEFLQLYAKWVGQRVFLPDLGVYAAVWNVTNDRKVQLSFHAPRSGEQFFLQQSWEVWADISVLDVYVVLA